MYERALMAKVSLLKSCEHKANLPMFIYKQFKIIKEMGIADHLTCLPRNLYTD